MNIVHVLTSLNIGGAERFVIDLSTLQINEGHKVKIISFGKNNEPLVEVCQQLNIDVAFIQGGMLERTKKLKPVFAWGDVIHYHSPHAMKASILALPSIKKKNVIYTRHGAHPFDHGQWKLLHRIFKYFVTSSTFVSQDGNNVFNKVHNWSNVPTKTIENGIIMPKINPPKPTKNKVKFGSVGRMVGLKNQISLLQAVAALPVEIRNNLEVHFYGDGECMNTLQAFTKDHLSDDDIVFHGVVKDRDIIYNNIDLLVVTSETEGLSLAIIEAMSYYKPTLASNVGGNPRLVVDDKTGHLFEYNDVPVLSALIKSYVDSRSLISDQGMLARQHVEHAFSLESTWKNYKELYEGK